MKNVIIVLVVLIMASACGSRNNAATTTETQPARSEKPARGGQPSIEEIFRMDTNNDGKLSQTEVAGPLQRDFARIDANGDGFITRTELENAPRPQRGERPRKN